MLWALIAACWCRNKIAKVMVNPVSLWLLGWPFGPTPRSKVMVASAGRPCFAPSHPLCVQCGKPWEAPGMLCEKRHNEEAETERSSTDSPLLNKWVLLILPAWWNQIIITGSITDTAVTLACMISKNSNPMLLFINSPARERGQREHKPQQ